MLSNAMSMSAFPPTPNNLSLTHPPLPDQDQEQEQEQEQEQVERRVLTIRSGCNRIKVTISVIREDNDAKNADSKFATIICTSKSYSYLQLVQLFLMLRPQLPASR